MVFESLKKIILEKKQKPQEKRFLVTRQFEENKILQILNKLQKNNCIIIGNKGVGKTSILSNLKEKINSDIVVIDDIHLLNEKEALDLRQKIINKEVQCLVSTTFSVFKSYKDVDGFFRDNFTPVSITEPEKKDLVAILNYKAKELSEYHELSITSALIDKIVVLSKRYLQNEYLPSSAIDVLDGICAKKRIENAEIPSEIENVIKSITELKSCRLDLAKKIELKALEAKHDKLYNDWQLVIDNNKNITLFDVYNYFSEETGLSISKISQSFEDKIFSLEDVLNLKVVGQSNAIKEICDSIKHHFLEKENNQKPLSLCFSGPIGVGKYKVAKEIASYLFDTTDNLVAKPLRDYQVVITQDVFLSANKKIKNSILIYKSNNDFVEKVIDFAKLEKKEARIIAKAQVKEIEESLKHKNIRIEVEEQVYMFLLAKGYSLDKGVEGLRSLIRAEIYDKIIKLMSRTEISNSTLFVYFEKGALEVKVKNC
ncbi:MAG: hypothetical protein R3Y43_07630 [Alphaproteobacteria bacterium]